MPAVEQLTSYFASYGSITASDKTKAVSQYRALVVKFRSSQVDRTVDWFTLLPGYYELHCRPELHQVFKYACLCLPPVAKIHLRFVVPIPELGPDEEMFQSCVTSIQVSYATVPNVSSLFRDPRSISRVFRLLGKDKDLLSDRKSQCGSSLKAVDLEELNYRQSLRILIKVWLPEERMCSLLLILMLHLVVVPLVTLVLRQQKL